MDAAESGTYMLWRVVAKEIFELQIGYNATETHRILVVL